MALEDIQDEIIERLHAGENVDRAALLEAHPEHTEDLRAFFALLDAIEGPAEAAPAPARLGEFRIVRELGRGGMGIVYEAEQPSLNRRVALKVLPPTLRMDPRLVSRFRREAEAAGRLRHPGIVPVFSVGEAAGAPFFAMELVDGETLDARIRRRRAETAGDRDEWRRSSVEIVARVADALAYAHAQGILHRDVKPGNVIVGKDGTPRLTDFGLALDLQRPGLTLTGEIFGSPQYMSPEQAVRQEAPVDQRTDVYSLAVTLYELLTLRLPYDADTNAELLTALATGRVIPPRRADPSMPRALEAVLLRALRRDPRERYETATAFAADLRAALAGGRIEAPTRRRTRLVAVVAAAAVLVAAGLFAIPRLAGNEAPLRAAGELSRWLGIARKVRENDTAGVASADLAWLRDAAATAMRFCIQWKPMQDAQSRPLYAKLEEELKLAGAAAGPALLEILGTNQYDAFFRVHAQDGVTAWMQVAALRGIFLLDLKEAAPYALLHCRGPSLTCTSNAALVLEKFTGENFDAEFLKEVDVAKIDWWAKNRVHESAAFRALIDQILRELRDNVEGRGPEVRGGGDWWRGTGQLIVRDLSTLLDTSFPCEETLEEAEQIELVTRIEGWWREHGGGGTARR